MSRTRTSLLAASAGAVLLTASSAWAQTQEPRASGDQLEEVVVTATRQADTVNRVPLSVTAQTQRNLDQQGIRTITDLQGTVPALQVTQQLGSGVGNFAIRGIVQSAAGAATTGFYLDDTPLQKRNVGGGVGTGNGTPIPPLFDLDRIEVLRGPQGTLYGGSSEGGTIRYIQPAPSLTRYSEYVRLQYSTPKHGADSYQAGAAIGGPIIQDKLGFRVSAFASRQGGFIDMVDPITRQVWDKNTGQNKVRELRAALSWAITDRARLTFSYFSSQDKTDNNDTTYTLPVPGGFSVQTTCYNTAVYPQGATFPTANPPPSALGPRPVGFGAAACAAASAGNPAIFTRPGVTYGPYNLSRYQSLAADTSPAKTNLQIATLTLDYHFDQIDVRAISSYIDDQNKAVSGNSVVAFSRVSPIPALGDPTGPPNVPSVVTDPRTGQSRIQTFLPTFSPLFGPGPTRAQLGHFTADNKRYGFTQEVRFSSAPNAGRLSWIGGVFYSNIRNPQKYDNYTNLDVIDHVLYGYPLGQNGVRQQYGTQALETAPGLFNNFDARRQKMKDVEVAGFAEVNYWLIPEKLRLTTGLRVSRVTFDYSNLFVGPVTGVGADSANPALRSPNPQNGGANSGSVAESPVTPKIALQYNITSDDLVYLQASKGFRPGGVNPLPSVGICGLALSVYGLAPAELPQTYQSDSVWAYEAGGKFRLLNGRVQLNGAAYRIDWKNPQVTMSPGFNCGLASTYNAGAARSQGFEVEAQARPIRNLTLNAAFGYVNSKFTTNTIGVTGPTGVNLQVSKAGQKLALPPYTISVGGRYDLDLAPKLRGYVRADWRYAAAYNLTDFTSPQYNPDNNRVPTIQNTNMRLGVEYGDFDINVFANNVFDRKSAIFSGGGRTGCRDGTAACSVYSAFNPLYQMNTGYPREVGIQIAYRH